MVATNNRAKHLYERQGYRVTDTDGGCIGYCATGIWVQSSFIFVSAHNTVQ